jgi:hypothetical protein
MAKHKQARLALKIAKLATKQSDPEVRDAFAYVADFLHLEVCGDTIADCGVIAEGYSDEDTIVGSVLQDKLVLPVRFINR